ncbi:unnamed protein product [Rhizoctonia solani]|uniref:mitogen-activated protein kinase kinase kinase n=1 Tax=Rhizoctonia solani TaxID=456999 RepID=A0A8H3A4H5_9AGAM|nr:unnamed protein product [Rhizoctonia solani]
MATNYISVRTALYDFTPEGDDGGQLLVRKGEMLLLLDASNDNWLRFRAKTSRQDNDGSSGFVPREYTQEAKFISVATASGDFAARADGDLMVAENETLLVYAIEDNWALVTSPHRRATGYVLTARIRIEEKPNQAIALYHYDALNSDELSFKQGEILTVINNDNEEWWCCANEVHNFGLVPFNYVKLQTEFEHATSVNTSSAASEDDIAPLISDVEDVMASPLKSVITSQMGVSEVTKQLTMHGVMDLTSFIDHATFSEYPVSSDGFGDVYLGSVRDGRRVTVKVIRVHGFGDSKGLKVAAHELYVWSKCHHANVLSLLGLAMFRGRVGIVSPWVEDGDLVQYLKRTPGVNRYKLCIEICNGLAYLHSVGIVHADLKASNILVSRDGVPLLAELGNSWLVNPSLDFTASTNQPLFSIRWAMVMIHATSIQSRKMAAREVISHLVARGCRDISSKLELSSFGDYPTISEGGFSDIYKGELLDSTAIALKVLRVSVDSIAETKHLRRAAIELHTWNRCSHPNIMPLLGLTVFRERIGMASLWMKHGNLPRYLKEEPNVNRLNMCAQICEGLTYLHQNNIVHCDIKGANVLISDEGIPVLTDFGTSLVLDRTMRFTPTTGGFSYTLRWSAAEIVQETHPHTEASDVYALGMTIYVGYEADAGFFKLRLHKTRKQYQERFRMTGKKIIA